MLRNFAIWTVPGIIFCIDSDTVDLENGQRRARMAIKPTNEMAATLTNCIKRRLFCLDVIAPHRGQNTEASPTMVRCPQLSNRDFPVIGPEFRLTSAPIAAMLRMELKPPQPYAKKFYALGISLYACYVTERYVLTALGFTAKDGRKA